MSDRCRKIGGKADEPTPLRRLRCSSPSCRRPGGRGPFTLFETGQVRPLALSPDGTRLFAVNTPDNRLEIFDVGVGSLTHVGSVPVGLEPVAVAARTNTEVWVVNHLSDSVSIVDVERDADRARRAHAARRRRAARHRLRRPRRQPRLHHDRAPRPEHAAPPTIETHDGGRRPRRRLGVRRRRTSARRSAARRSPSSTLFGDTPRALAVTPTATPSTRPSSTRATGRRRQRGRRLQRRLRAGSCNVGGTSYPGGLPAPNTQLPERPGARGRADREVRRRVDQWRDELGRNWNNGGDASRCPTRTCSRSTPSPTRRSQIAGHGLRHRRRHDPLQHGREPGEREGLRLQHRGA